MRGELKKEGKYELFETTHQHHILSLDNKEYYALVEGQQGDLIIHSDSDHKKDHTISKGKFYYADFEDDPEFRDMAHFFMEDGDHFRELILPQGFPNDKDHQKKLVRTDDKLSKDKVMEHVKGKGNKGSEKQYQDKPEGLRNKTKEELYHLAQKHDIEGRSKMDKNELVNKLKDKVQQ